MKYYRKVNRLYNDSKTLLNKNISQNYYTTKPLLIKSITD